MPWPTQPQWELPADGHLYHSARRGLTEALVPAGSPSNHAATLVQLPGGDLLASWFGGSDEGNPDISLWVSRLDQHTGVWEAARQVTDDPDRSDQNPGLFLASPEELWLVYPAQLARRPDRHETFNLQHTAEIRRSRSTDGGRTWAAPEVMLDRPGSFSRQPIQILESGRWILPTWICFDDDTKNGSDITVIQISDDAGRSWTGVDVPSSAGCVHANVVELTPGELVALFRSRYADRIYISRSRDNGDSWSPPRPTVLANNNSSIAAIKLPSGRLGVVYNDLSFSAVRGQVFWPYERPALTIAVSDDAGLSFPWRRLIEPGDGFTGYGNRRSNHRHEYPAALVDAHEDIHVLWSYHSRECLKHAFFDEAWIEGVPQQLTGDCKLWT
ncbi:MAG: exo-alpha-sialidase [Propioniciclava sp.]